MGIQIFINTSPRKTKKYKIPKSIKSIYQAPFLNTDHSPIDILIKLEEQSKDKTEARNLCLKDHYNQLYLESSFQEPVLQSTHWFHLMARFSLADVWLTFICINEVEAVLVCASGFHVV